MLAWMLYVVTVSLLLGGAAFAAERVALLRRAPTRWLWLATIVASLLVPATIASVSIDLPRLQHTDGMAAAAKSPALRQTTSAALAPSQWLLDAAPQLAAKPDLGASLRRIWIAASGTLLLLLLLSAAHLYWRRRQWQRGSVAGADVYITEEIGPAVVGLLRPSIVVPRWVLDCSQVCQQQVIAHERAHLEGHDALLLTVALFPLVCMPWNLPLWWQLRRLRYAIEVDCDARVLRHGNDVRTYGETLLAVCRRQSGYVGAVAGMSESHSLLEQRIRIMMSKPGKWWRAAMIGLGGASFALVALAAQVEPPNAGEEHHQIDLAPTVLDNYTGYYKLTDSFIIAVTRQGSQLSTQATGQNSAPIYPESQTSFFYKVVNAQIEFVTDTQGRATALVLHQNGMDHTGPRIDDAVAGQMAEALQTRIRNQSPLPGSETAAQHLIADVASGKPNYDEMSPDLADAFRRDIPMMQSMLANLGPVTSVKFIGVGNQGWDIYKLSHEHGTSELRLLLDSKGIITGAVVNAGP
jgi:bla regulator protein blaR1